MFRIFTSAAALLVLGTTLGMALAPVNAEAREKQVRPRAQPQVIIRDRSWYGPPPPPPSSNRNYYGPAPTIQAPMERVQPPAPLAQPPINR